MACELRPACRIAAALRGAQWHRGVEPATVTSTPLTMINESLPAPGFFRLTKPIGCEGGSVA
jgi:hypothetical protein